MVVKQGKQSKNETGHFFLFLIDISSAVTLHWLFAVCQIAQPNTNPTL